MVYFVSNYSINNNNFMCNQAFGSHGTYRFDPIYINDGDNILTMKFVGNSTAIGTFSIIGMRYYILDGDGVTLRNPTDVRDTENTDFTTNHTTMQTFDVPFTYNL